MKPRWVCAAIALLALATSLVAQSPDVKKILADARAALGGEKKLSALTTFTATGQSVRVTPDGSSAPTDCEMAFELPDKFMKKEVVTTMGNFAVTRTSGFNGDAAIEIIDQPPAMPGTIRIVIGSGADPNAPATPEQQAENLKKRLLSAKQEFARVSLGMLVSSLAAYPLDFAYGGVAESPDGKADIVDVKGDGGFAVRLFIDQKTHLPLMLSWMGKEPLMISRTVSGGRDTSGAGRGAGAQGALSHAQAPPPTAEERDKLMKQAQAQAKEAEAKLRVVEYRLYYGDYRDVDGVKVPFRMQGSIDGKPMEEMTLEKVKINGKVDPGKFAVK